MNVYDFDKTIYDGDSTVDFYFFCLLRKPVIIFRLPYQLVAVVLYKLKCISKTRLKECFFVFLRDIEDVNKEVVLFWDENETKMKAWYKRQAREDDLVISASPRFLLKEICKRNGISRLIASEVDVLSGSFDGENCYGEEKVRRYQVEYIGDEIHDFYSDSMSDWPLAEKAKRAFIVKGNRVEEWVWNEKR